MGRVVSRRVEEGRIGEIIHMVEGVERQKFRRRSLSARIYFRYVFFSPRPSPASKAPASPFTHFNHIHPFQPHSICKALFILVISVHFYQ